MDSDTDSAARNATGIDECRLVKLREFTDQRGSLAVVEGLIDMPFEMRRVYYLYDFVPGMRRGGHAHKRLHQLFIAVAGAFDVLLDDGRAKKTIRLSDPGEALYVCPMMWREIDNVAPGSVCLVLASTNYDEDDYYRSHDEFRKAVTRRE